MKVYELGVFVSGSPTFCISLIPNVTFQSLSCFMFRITPIRISVRRPAVLTDISFFCQFFQVQYDSTSDETTNASPK